MKDALLKRSLALPNGAATTTSTSIDVGKQTSHAQAVAHGAQFDWKLTAPALTTGELADADTMRYDVLLSDYSDLSSPTVYITGAITQTGAGGAGAAAATFDFRIPSTAKRYLGFRAVNSDSGNASGKTATLEGEGV